MICSFCSLLCDSDHPSHLSCSRRDAGLNHLESVRRSISHLHSSHIDAVARIQLSLRNAKRVLVTGRVASVQTAREAVAFASQFNATLDCAESGCAFSNILAIQRSGMNSVSIAEARQLADVLVVVGNDSLLSAFPRLPQALYSEKRFGGAKLGVLLLGEFSESAIRQWRSFPFDVWSIPCQLEQVPNAWLQWHRWNTNTHGMTHNEESSKLLSMLNDSKYTAIIWASSQLAAPQPDLWVERMLEGIRLRNETHRTAALMLSSLDGTFQQTCTWLTGFPGRIQFRDGVPTYDPSLNSYANWLSCSNETNGPSVAIEIDETSSVVPFALGYSSDELTTKNVTRWKLTPDSVSTPVFVAGHEFECDVFRADLTVAARVLPPESNHVPLIFDRTGQDPQNRSDQVTAAELLRRLRS